jgi:hypothetical protein
MYTKNILGIINKPFTIKDYNVSDNIISSADSMHA